MGFGGVWKVFRIVARLWGFTTKALSRRKGNAGATRGPHTPGRAARAWARRPRQKARTCYNCGDKSHFVADCPFEKREDNGGRLVRRNNSKTLSKGFSKFSSKPGDNKVSFTKKPKAFIICEEYSSDEGGEHDDKSSNKEDEGVAAIAISTPSNSLFDSPNENLVTNNSQKLAALRRQKTTLLEVNSLQEEALMEYFRLSKEKVTCCNHEEKISALKRNKAKLLEINATQEEALKECFPLSKECVCCDHEEEITSLERHKCLLLKMNSLQEDALKENFRVDKEKEIQVFDITHPFPEHEDEVNRLKAKIERTCVEGKMHGAPHNAKTTISTTRCLELLDVDLFDLSSHESIGGKKYCLVIVDDYSRYCWVFFFKYKSETQRTMMEFSTQVQCKFDTTILAIRSDNGTEFKNYTLDDFFGEEGIQHQYSTPYTPQQNGVAKRKNQTFIEAARTMMMEYKSNYNFWAEAISTACHATNRLYFRKGLEKTPYEILTGNKPNVSYFKVFGCKCYVLIKDVRLSKFDSRAQEGTGSGWTSHSNTFPPTHLKSRPAAGFKIPEETGPDLLLRPSPAKSPPWRSFPTLFSTMATGSKPRAPRKRNLPVSRCQSDIEEDDVLSPRTTKHQRAAAAAAKKKTTPGPTKLMDQLTKNQLLAVRGKLDSDHEYFGEAKVICEELGIVPLITFNHPFSREVICQFYATVQFDVDENGVHYLTWMTKEHLMKANWEEFAHGLGYQLAAPNNFNVFRVHLAHKPMKKEKMINLYLAGRAVCGSTYELLPTYAIMLRVFRNTVKPQEGKSR
ncbi:hypothetical protein QYE76_004048 [Lolium multiflorum]|uniref:Gag-pol polyprotein n=1 Tax=Lolium multiflorum TaxID=4521 RepID=A0AAD8W1U9_LOLMU|nr:hypothetical protein QYE76_004048 [Lolium multiflorum]